LDTVTPDVSYRDYMDLALTLDPIHLWDFCPEGAGANWAVGTITTPAAGFACDFDLTVNDDEADIIPDLGSFGDFMGQTDVADQCQPGPDGSECALEFVGPGIPSIASRITSHPQRDENGLPGDFTVGLWCTAAPALLTDTAFHSIMITEVNCPGSQFTWALYRGGTSASPRLGVRTFNGGTATHLDAQSTAAISADTWYFIVGEYDSSAIDLFYYQDGALEASDLVPSGSRGILSNREVRIGDFCFEYAGLALGPVMYDYRIGASNISDLYDAMFA
jgi:hypothetical protein